MKIVGYQLHGKTETIPLDEKTEESARLVAETARQRAPQQNYVLERAIVEVHVTIEPLK